MQIKEHFIRAAFILVSLLAVFHFPACAESGKSLRPDHWAVPMEISGLPNFHQVTAELYRGAQPTEAGFRELKKMGVRTVVNLRSLHSDKDEIGSTELEYEYIPMKAWHPEEEDIVRFLRIVTDKNRKPVFVHCQHGADHTGTVCAIYRIAVCGWTKEEAISEMTQGGFGFHKIWMNLVRFIRDINIHEIKRKSDIRN